MILGGAPRVYSNGPHLRRAGRCGRVPPGAATGVAERTYLVIVNEIDLLLVAEVFG